MTAGLSVSGIRSAVMASVSVMILRMKAIAVYIFFVNYMLLYAFEIVMLIKV